MKVIEFMLPITIIVVYVIGYIFFIDKIEKVYRLNKPLITQKSYLIRAHWYSKYNNYIEAIKTIDRMLKKYNNKLSKVYECEAMLDKAQYLYYINDYKNAVLYLNKLYVLLIKYSINSNKDVLMNYNDIIDSIEKIYIKANKKEEFEKWNDMLKQVAYL